MTSALLTALALGLYLVTAVCFGAVLFLRSPAAPAPSGAPLQALTRNGRLLLLLGIAIQFASVGVWCATTRRSPFASEYGTLVIAAWTVAIAYGALDLKLRLPAVGAVALTFACILLLWGILHVGGPIADAKLLANGMVSLHVLTILASFACFVLAFGCAALYLVQNRLLKKRQVSGMFRRLPPLQTLDSVAYHAVACAMPMLTLGLALGLVLIYNGIGASPMGRWLTDPHTLTSFAAWFLYVFYLGARLAAGWRGVRLQYVLLIGLLVALALYIMPTATHRFS